MSHEPDIGHQRTINVVRPPEPPKSRVPGILIGAALATVVAVGVANRKEIIDALSNHSPIAADSGASDASSDQALDGGSVDASPDAGQQQKTLKDILAAKIASAPAIDKETLNPEELAHQRPRFQLKKGKWEALPNDKNHYPVFQMDVDSEPVVIAVYYNSELERAEGPHITLGKGGPAPTNFVNKFTATMNSKDSTQWGFVAIGPGCASDSSRDRTNILYNTGAAIYKKCPNESYTGKELDVSPTLKGSN